MFFISLIKGQLRLPPIRPACSAISIRFLPSKYKNSAIIGEMIKNKFPKNRMLLHVVFIRRVNGYGKKVVFLSLFA